MTRRNNLVFILILAIFVVSALFAFPVGSGSLPWKKGIRLGLDLQGGTRIVFTANLTGIAASDVNNSMEGTIAVLENRINPLGVSETSVRRLGEDQILVEIPGKTLTEEEKASLGRVALLEFGEQVTGNETARWSDALGNWKPATGLLNGNGTELTSRYFKTNTYVDRDNLGNIRLQFEWDAEGSQLSQQITSRLIGIANTNGGK